MKTAVAGKNIKTAGSLRVLTQPGTAIQTHIDWKNVWFHTGWRAHGKTGVILEDLFPEREVCFHEIP